MARLTARQSLPPNKKACDEFLPILCRPPDLCGSPVDHYLCRRCIGDLQAAGVRISRRGAAVGRGACNVPRRQSESDCRNGCHATGTANQWRRKHVVHVVAIDVRWHAGIDRHVQGWNQCGAGRNAGAEPRAACIAAPAGRSAANRRDDGKKLAESDDGGPLVITERPL